MVDLAVDLGIIKKSGAWFSYEDGKIGQGRENTKEWLKNNPDKMKEIEEKIKEKASEVVLVSKKSKKAAALEEAAAEAAAEAAGEAVSDPGPFQTLSGLGKDLSAFFPIAAGLTGFDLLKIYAV